MTQQDIRWKQRFENLQAAFKNLSNTVNANSNKADDIIIELALIKSFEITFELSWKTMKDYLIYSGTDVNSPREVIKQAFANNIIEDGQLWINMLSEKNLMNYVYDEHKAEKYVKLICIKYIYYIEKLCDFFMNRYKIEDSEFK